MREAAADLKFEDAARLRDEVKRLRAAELAVPNDPTAKRPGAVPSPAARPPLPAPLRVGHFPPPLKGEVGANRPERGIARSVNKVPEPPPFSTKLSTHPPILVPNSVTADRCAVTSAKGQRGRFDPKCCAPTLCVVEAAPS